MIKHKRRPKQDFDINYRAIRRSNLNEGQQNILMSTLEFHQDNCKLEYNNMLNSDLITVARQSESTMLKNRKILEQEKYFTLNKVRTGKSFVLQYRFNWTKLLKLEFIKSNKIEPSEFSPKFAKKVNKQEPTPKEGELLTMKNRDLLQDDTYYQVNQFHLDKEENRWGSPILLRNDGKTIKRLIKSQENIAKRDAPREQEYIYKGKIK
ncbi:hypothetical protein [Arenibacter troitsensis]|uniref:Helix-turn-helix domain-containing protein n=1 Tax=Arenibacter troitsensis TaxID=188872 RepID=A0A1X7J7C0_9FLAO|nr:hypothetical protein [Arenibacter troitsensis]SMG23614.1 hypothetical protein SAMN03080602_01463 [Arenibacter troitsensis]